MLFQASAPRCFPLEMPRQNLTNSSASPVLVNGAKTQSIWTHEKKIPFILILETTSKGEEKKENHQHNKTVQARENITAEVKSSQLILKCTLQRPRQPAWDLVISRLELTYTNQHYQSKTTNRYLTEMLKKQKDRNTWLNYYRHSSFPATIIKQCSEIFEC